MALTQQDMDRARASRLRQYGEIGPRKRLGELAPSNVSMGQKKPSLLGSIGSAITRNVTRFGGFVGNAVAPSGVARIEQERFERASQKSELYRKQFKSGQLSKEAYNRLTGMLNSEFRELSTSASERTKAIPTAGEVAGTAAGLALDIATVGTLSALKGAKAFKLARAGNIAKRTVDATRTAKAARISKDLGKFSALGAGFGASEALATGETDIGKILGDAGKGAALGLGVGATGKVIAGTIQRIRGNTQLLGETQEIIRRMAYNKLVGEANANKELAEILARKLSKAGVSQKEISTLINAEREGKITFKKIDEMLEGKTIGDKLGPEAITTTKVPIEKTTKGKKFSLGPDDVNFGTGKGGQLALPSPKGQFIASPVTKKTIVGSKTVSKPVEGSSGFVIKDFKKPQNIRKETRNIINKIEPKSSKTSAKPTVAKPHSKGETKAAENTIVKINKAVSERITEGKKLTGKRAASITKQRGDRLAKSSKAYDDAMARGDFEEAHRIHKASQKGSFDKPGVTPLSEVVSRKELTRLKGVVQKFYRRETIKNGKKEIQDDRFNAGKVNDALEEMFESGTVPAKHVLDRMGDVFGDDFAKTIQKTGKVPGETLLNRILGAPRAILSSYDISMGGRQGLTVAARHPREWASANKESFKYLGNAKYYEDEMQKLSATEYGQMWQKSGGNIFDVEETFKAAGLAENIPLFGVGLKASQRAYSGGLTKMRLDIFKKQIDALGGPAKAQTILGEKGTNQLVEVINTFTGRGGKKNGWVDANKVTLTNALFSPRLWASRLQMLNPFWYPKLHPVARRAALENAASFASLAGLVLATASAMGATVERDPRSSDFLKIKVGDTRYDILGGLQQNIVFAYRFATGETKSSTTGKVTKYGEKFMSPSRYDALLNLVENKATPTLGAAISLAKGKKIGGAPVRPAEELGGLVIPLSLQGTFEAAKEDGAKGVAKQLPEYLGIGVGTYTGKEGKEELRYVRWLDRKGTPEEKRNYKLLGIRSERYK